MKNIITPSLLFHSLIFCFFTTVCIGQEIIPLGDSLTKDDLSFLKDKIQNKRVVLLGELDHGDGSTFIHKTTIIKYLHENMGFNVVAFEAPFSELGLLNEYSDNISVDSTTKALYSVWSKVQETQSLFKYIEEKNIILTGFDTRHSSKRTLITDSLQMYFNLDVTDDKIETTLHVMDTLLSYEYESISKINSIEKNIFFTVIDSLILSNQAMKLEGDKRSFWYQILSSIKGCAKNAWDKDPVQSDMKRDKQMAGNLIWLINNKYKNEKIIVWAANFHIIKNQGNFITGAGLKKYPNYQLMGDHLYKAMGDSIYVIPFIHFEGNATGLDKKIKRQKKSFESELSKVDNYVYVDMKNCTKKLTINSSYHEGFGKNTSNEWSTMFDALIFTKKVIPSSKIKEE